KRGMRVSRSWDQETGGDEPETTPKKSPARERGQGRKDSFRSGGQRPDCDDYVRDVLAADAPDRKLPCLAVALDASRDPRVPTFDPGLAVAVRHALGVIDVNDETVEAAADRVMYALPRRIRLVGEVRSEPAGFARDVRLGPVLGGLTAERACVVA